MTTEPERHPDMPHIHPAAWHGALGESVRRVAPTTEADPVAILGSLLALFGAMAGDASHVRVGGVRHPARIWPMVIGKTGSGRKGTSWAEARRLAAHWSTYAHGYTRTRIKTGLISGEGLIGALGGTPVPTAPTGRKSDEPPPEAAAPDGRLTVLETEFARVLAATKRDGNTLGPVLRQLWDDGAAASLTRASPTSVDNAHLVLVGHITPREFRMKLAESDLAGGTVNRFLLLYSERPALLPHEPEPPDVASEAEWLGKCLDRARQGGRMHRDSEAEKLWSTEIYAALSQDEPDGQLGAVLARGPAYTMRLALAYALADGQAVIGSEHLLAGLAVWHYATQSARLIFPEGRRADDMERLAKFLALAGGGRTRTQITQFFAKNRRADELDAMLEEYEMHGQVERAVEYREGPGRPTVRYQWTGQERDPVLAVLRRHWTQR